MKLRNIFETLSNKSPKMLLIIVILMGLSVNQKQLFGYRFADEEKDNLAVLEKATQRYFNEPVRLVSDDNMMFEVTDSADVVVGYVVWSESVSDLSHGYGGRTPVAIFLNPEQYITSVRLLQSNETGRFVARLQNEGFFDRWNGKHILDDVVNPDAVSGATLTSNSVMANVKAIMDNVVTNRNRVSGTDWSSVLPQLVVLLIVVLSLLCFFVPGHTKWLRIPTLVLSIAILGVWQGAFVSIDLLYKWMLNGTSFVGRFSLIAIVLTSIFIPLLLSRSYYCTYLCPFGAIQELLGKLNNRKLVVPRMVLLIFRIMRQLFLVTIVVLLFVNPYFDPSVVEPFAVFMINSAAVSVIIIAALGLIGSLFVHRAWCRLLCPTGELLSFLQRRLKWSITKIKRKI